MTTEYPERIWFHPPRFWAATRNMTKEEAERLQEKVYRLAELHDIEHLRQYDFISIGNPYRKAA
jgi:N-acetyl-gamma-glutamylphosphate reductase